MIFWVMYYFENMMKTMYPLSRKADICISGLPFRAQPWEEGLAGGDYGPRINYYYKKMTPKTASLTVNCLKALVCIQIKEFTQGRFVGKEKSQRKRAVSKKCLWVRVPGHKAGPVTTHWQVCLLQSFISCVLRARCHQMSEIKSIWNKVFSMDKSWTV